MRASLRSRAGALAAALVDAATARHAAAHHTTGGRPRILVISSGAAAGAASSAASAAASASSAASAAATPCATPPRADSVGEALNQQTERGRGGLLSGVYLPGEHLYEAAESEARLRPRLTPMRARAAALNPP